MTIFSGIETSKLSDPNQVHFPHPVSRLRLIETHISWVLLTGDFAYKIKKPVKFDFVDYSTVELRQWFCEKEIKLNQQYAKQLYLEVVPIFQAEDGYWIGQSPQVQNSPIDFAVKMTQFPQSSLVASRLKGDTINAAVVDQFGKDLAQFHAAIATGLEPTKFGTYETIKQLSDDNFTVLLEALQGSSRESTLIRLREWSQQELNSKREWIDQRQKSNFVRPGHGDLHLKNIVQMPNGKLLPFDGIEFNDSLQWNDIVSEIAFPVMDFSARGRPDLGWRLYNAWMEESNDPQSIQLFRLFLVYRAMVRAKVTWLNPAHHQTSSVQSFQLPDAGAFDSLAGPWDRYLKIASDFAFPPKPRLVITHGFSGSGKSTAAMNWIERFGGVRFRSDWVRKHHFGHLELPERYSVSTSQQVYNQLLDWAAAAIDNQISPVLDATFLNQADRHRFQDLAQTKQIPFLILDCRATFEELSQRIESRVGDLSEATIAVLKKQIDSHQPLTSAEQSFVVKSDQIDAVGYDGHDESQFILKSRV